MGVKFLKWNMDRVVDMIVSILLNKFDCFIAIEGKRGLGKSTLAWIVARRVSTRFKKVRSEIPECKGWYHFNPKSCLLYKRDDVIKFFNKWNKTAIADEMINVTFNRDFYSEDQKTLIKMINMNRDHGNLFIACVPQFQTLDTQIKNLTKIKITVVRRGFAIIHTPNHTIYSRDIWDSAYNEKIERQWLQKKVANPKYARLTTCRGYLKFPDLTPKTREVYETIKKDQRNMLMKEQAEGKNKEKKDPVKEILEMLINGSIKNGTQLEGSAYALDMTPSALKNKLSKLLEKKKMPTALTEYYWEGKKRRQEKENPNLKTVALIKSL